MESTSRRRRFAAPLTVLTLCLVVGTTAGSRDESVEYKVQNVGASMRIPLDWYTLDAARVHEITKANVASTVTYDVGFVRDSSEALVYPYILLTSFPGDQLDIYALKNDLDSSDINAALERSTGMKNALIGRPSIDVQPSRNRVLWRFTSTDKHGDESCAVAAFYAGKHGGLAVYCYRLRSDSESITTFQQVLDSVKLVQPTGSAPPVNTYKPQPSRDTVVSNRSWRVLEAGLAGVLVTLMAAALVWVAGRAFTRKTAHGSSAEASHSVPGTETAASQQSTDTICDHGGSIVKTYPHGIVRRYLLMIFLIIAGVLLTTVAIEALDLTNSTSGSPMLNMIGLIPVLAYWDWLRRSAVWKCRVCKRNVPWAG